MSPAHAEGGIVATFLIGAIAQLVVSLLLHAWGGWVAERRGGTRGWRLARWMPLVAFAMSVTGVGLSSVMLVRAFGAVAAVEPAHKATLLARGISEAMNVTAVLVLPSWALYAASVAAFVVGTVRRPPGGGAASGSDVASAPREPEGG